MRSPSLCLSGLGAALSLLVLVSGCGKRELAVESGRRTQTIHLGNLTEPNDLDPHIVDSQQTFNIVMGLVEGLAQYHPQTCEPVPAVATRWTQSEDGLRWTFHLRPEARWSNGDPVTARDFLWSYQRVLTPSLAAEYASMLFVLRNAEAYYTGTVKNFGEVGVSAPDDHTLVLDLARPVPYLDKLVCHAIWYPVHRPTLEKHGDPFQRGSKWTRPGNFVGNGYFVLAEWRPNQFVRLTKSPTYWERDRVLLNEAIFYPVENSTTEESMFRAGQLHVTSSIPTEKIAVYKEDPALAGLLHQEVLLATYFYRFNVTRPPFNDVRVRKALSLAIDRSQIVERVSKGGQPPAGHLTPPGIAGFEAGIPAPHDPEKARALLAEAGFPGGKGFPKFDILFNTNEGHRQIAEAIQQMWRRELGVDTGLYNQESKVYVATMRTLDYAVARFAWVGDYLDPTTFLDIMKSDSGNNQTGWANSEYDALLRKAELSRSQEERYSLFKHCEQILAEEIGRAHV